MHSGSLGDGALSTDMIVRVCGKYTGISLKLKKPAALRLTLVCLIGKSYVLEGFEVVQRVFRGGIRSQNAGM